MFRPRAEHRLEVTFVERLVDLVEPVELLITQQEGQSADKVTVRDAAEDARVVMRGDRERLTAERELEGHGGLVEFERVKVERHRGAPIVRG
jgi:hypothetical protein